MQKNTAGKWIVFAFQDEGGSNPGEPVTGDAANITANVRIDGGAANAVDDVNPTELEDGYYIFDITAAEANGDLLLIAPVSATANVNVIGCPAAIYTTPANFPAMNLTASGNCGIDWANVENPTTAVDLSATDIQLCDTVTTNTDMRGTDSAYTGTPPTVAAIADAVWDESTVGHTTTGTFGEQVKTDIDQIKIDTGVVQTDLADGGRLDLIFDAILVDTGTTLPATLATAQADLDTLTGTDGVTLATSQPNYAPNTTTPPTAAAIADAVWDETQSTHTTAGSFGEIATEIAALQTDLDNGTDGLGAIKTAVDGLNDISTADVNAQVLDVLNTDTFAEPSAVPAATATLVDKISWIYTVSRNKMTQTSTTTTLRNDADSANIATSTVSDDGTTYTKGEYT